MEKRPQQANRETQSAPPERAAEQTRRDNPPVAGMALQTALKNPGAALSSLSPQSIGLLAQRVGNSAALELLARDDGPATTRFSFAAGFDSPLNSVKTARITLASPRGLVSGEGGAAQAGEARVEASSIAAIRSCGGAGLMGNAGGTDGTIPSR